MLRSKRFLSFIFAFLLALLPLQAHAGSYGFPQAAEDSAAASGDLVLRAGCKYTAGNDTAQVGTDGDYIVPTTNDVGNLKVQVEPSRKATYMATSPPVTRAASATDMFVINGSASKTVKILKVYASYYATGSGANHFYLNKQSTAGSGGTSTTITACPLDSNNAAATAVVKDYTANRTVGTLVATAAIKSVAAFVQANTGLDFTYCLFDADNGQPVVLRGTGEGFAVNNNGVTVPGTSAIVGFTVVWTEE